jgi:hypothetical protein
MAVTLITCKFCQTQFEFERQAGRRGRMPKYCSKACRGKRSPEEYKLKLKKFNEIKAKKRKDKTSTYYKKEQERLNLIKEERHKERRKACEGCGNVDLLYSNKKTFGSVAFCKSCVDDHKKQKKTDYIRRYKGRDTLPPVLVVKEKPTPITQTDHECKNCKQTFRPKRSERTTYCSRDCAFEYFNKLSALRAVMDVSYKVNVGKCAWCKSRFYGQRFEKLCCSSECQSKYKKLKEINKNPQRECKECKSVFERQIDNLSQVFCSDTCRNESARRTYRKGKASRKALERGARTADNIDPIAIFERDAWRCQICGCKTPKSKRGTIHDKAPELDHIIPLSKGGLHSFDNVQCTCRSCNAKKSDAVYGQMLLFPAVV